MSKLISTILIWAARKFVILALILAVLLLGAWLKSEWTAYRTTQRNISKQEELVRNLNNKLSELNRELAKTAEETRKLTEKWTDMEKTSRRLHLRVNQLKLERDYWDEHWYYRTWLSPGNVIKYQTNIAAYNAAVVAATQLDNARAKFRKVVEASEGAQLIQEKAQLERNRSELDDQIKADKDTIMQNPRQRVIATIYDNLPTAFSILLGIILTPILIKAVFYFVIAPAVSKLPSVRILGTSEEAKSPHAIPSAVSLSIELEPEGEVLILPDYLQSCGVSSKKCTRWFLNPKLPISSIASGLTMLTSIRSKDDQPTKVVVSAQTDAFGEVGIIELEAGSAMVIQPRSLVGVIKSDRGAIQISRHWRLGSLHSWLTLQLRFLVFHGPCKLILKGCRGIVAEAPDATGGRIINQDATIGFSANLEFRNTRCETFVSYLRGKESLFNDQFSGGPGLFVYEEMPGSDSKSGITGRGLEGLTDAALKVFGI